MKKIGTAARGSSAKQVQTKDGKATSRKTVDLNLFYAAVASKLREIDVLGENDDYRGHPAVNQAVELFEIDALRDVNSFDNAVQASAAFNDYIDRVGFIYQAPILYRTESLTVTLTVPTKSGEVSVSVEVTPLAELGEVIKAVRDDLTKQFNGAFAGGTVERKQLPETSKNGKKEYTVEEVNCTMLRVGTYNNKTVYHAIPSEGNWVQFGIPLYKDVAKSEGIELPEEEGEYDVSWDITYELKEDGKPRRVTSIKDV